MDKVNKKIEPVDELTIFQVQFFKRTAKVQQKCPTQGSRTKCNKINWGSRIQWKFCGQYNLRCVVYIVGEKALNYIN